MKSTTEIQHKRANILKQFQNGRGINQIALNFMVTPYTIRRHLKLSGVKFGYSPTHLSYAQDDVDKALELYDKGLSVKKVGRMLGHSRKVITSILKKNHIEIINRQQTKYNWAFIDQKNDFSFIGLGGH